MRWGVSSLLLFFIAMPLFAQDDSYSLVGIKLADLIERFGAPKAVLAARGNEIWQDDVVFQYDEGDFYIFRDRVWQIKLSSAHGVSLGDPRAAALLVTGSAAEDRGDHLLLPLAGSRPLMLRINFNNMGVVSSIFIYRPDF